MVCALSAEAACALNFLHSIPGGRNLPFWSYRQAEDSLREKAWDYSRDGMTQREIAAELRISLGRANKLLKEARDIHAG